MGERDKIYGSYKDGSDIYKDKKGYFIIQWDVKNEVEYKYYLKNNKYIDPDDGWMCRDKNGRLKRCVNLSKKKKSKKKSKRKSK
jgi:hypothetical protein